MEDNRRVEKPKGNEEPEKARQAGDFHPVCSAASLPVPGKLLTVVLDGDEVVIANVGGRYHAIQGLCDHAGAPLGEGTLVGCQLTCVLHGWTYDVTDGWLVNPPLGRRISSYQVRVVGGTVELASND